MNNLSTKLIKLDLDTILNNYCKPAFWKQKWQIYKHGDICIVARISTINVSENKIRLELKFDPDNIKFSKLHKCACIYYESAFVIIPINNPDYKKENFEDSILSAALNLLYILEEQLIKQYSEYKEASNLEVTFIESLKTIANKFLDDNKVVNEQIRRSYIDYYVYRCEIPRYKSAVLEKMHYTIIPSEYLILISFFNNKKTYEEYSKKCKKLRKSTRLKMWADGKKLNTPEFVSKMQEKLEAI